jgi:uncharacterized protein with PIN domain
MDCPKCEAVLSTVHAEPITVKTETGDWRGVCYVCPACSSVLSVGIDPMTLRNDLLEELLKRLGKK